MINHNVHTGHVQCASVEKLSRLEIFLMIWISSLHIPIKMIYIHRALRAFDKQWHIKCFVCSVNITFPYSVTFSLFWRYICNHWADSGMQEDFWGIPELLLHRQPASVRTVCRGQWWWIAPLVHLLVHHHVHHLVHLHVQLPVHHPVHHHR